MLNARAALRAFVGFFLALAFWFGFSRAYERGLAGAAQALTNLFESPDVTRLAPSNGEILLDRRDFPPGSARPGLPGPDIHFNFVLLVTLFALDRKPLRGAHVARFLAAAGMLFLVHVLALVFQVHSVYATSLGPWSAANYGPVARNFWAAGFHFYQIAGRFAAPFALWWLFGRREEELAPEKPARTKKRKRRA
ncbi:MAG TPA: hypothetical protein VGK86_13110 [Thermoanaerobaculia bacterium]|jgi:hypothetical protein